MQEFVLDVRMLPVDPLSESNIDLCFPVYVSDHEAIKFGMGLADWVIQMTPARQQRISPCRKGQQRICFWRPARSLLPYSNRLTQPSPCRAVRATCSSSTARPRFCRLLTTEAHFLLVRFLCNQQPWKTCNRAGCSSGESRCRRRSVFGGLLSVGVDVCARLHLVSMENSGGDAPNRILASYHCMFFFGLRRFLRAYPKCGERVHRNVGSYRRHHAHACAHGSNSLGTFATSSVSSLVPSSIHVH